MENTTREGQYAQAQISCTADEQLRCDEEFNWLMQCGTKGTPDFATAADDS